MTQVARQHWWRRHLITLMGMTVSVIALFLLAAKLELQEVFEVLDDVELLLLWPVPFLALTGFALRTVRWQTLIDRQPPVNVVPCFNAMMQGYLFNTILPARAGDLVRTLELARTQQMSRTKILATLVTEKIVDLGSVLVILSGVLLAYPDLPSWLGSLGVVIGLITGGLLALVLGLHLAGGDRVVKLTNILARALPAVLGARLEPMMRAGLEGLTPLFVPTRLLKISLLTGMIWSIEVLLVYQVALACGVNLSLGNALFVLVILANVSFVPASPGMIGTYEFFGVLAFNAINVASGEAFVATIVLHAIAIIGAVALGIICMALRPSSINSKTC